MALSIDNENNCFAQIPVKDEHMTVPTREPKAKHQ
jgi:hypothetical protein